MTDPSTVPVTRGAAPMAPAGPEASVIAFRRGALHFCCPVESVLEVLRGVEVVPSGGAPAIAGFLAYRGTYLAALDPVAVIGAGDASPAPTVVIAETGSGWVALLADDVEGLRTVERIVGAQWLAGDGPVRSSAMIAGLGHAYLITPAALAIYPTATPTADMNATAPAPAGEMYLTFTIGADRYAAAFPDIERVLHDCQPWPLPGGAFPLRTVVEANGSVIPVLEMENGPGPGRGLFVVLRTDRGPVAIPVDGVGRPERLSGDAGDAAWFAATGVSGLAQARSIAFKVVSGPALIAPILPGDVA